jgi:branched-chain amino acid transport system substrate-binding protein
MNKFNKRHFLKLTTASALAMSVATNAMAADPILLWVPTAQSDPVGVADQQDWLNGVNLALEEINAAGGGNGRMIETKVVDIDILSPEGGLDLSRFDAAPLIAFMAPKETNCWNETDGRIPR